MSKTNSAMTLGTMFTAEKIQKCKIFKFFEAFGEIYRKTLPSKSITYSLSLNTFNLLTEDTLA